MPVYSYYREEPRMYLAALALGLFTVSTLAHIFQLHRYRAKYFIAFVLGGVFQVIGFAGRIYSITYQTNFGSFIVQILFILLAPLMYAASIYGLLSRLINLTKLEKKMPIRPQWITGTFVAGDVFAFMMQATGGGMQSTGDPQKMALGANIVLAGLGVGLAFFITFLALLFRLQYLNRDAPPALKERYSRLLLVMQIGSFLILARSAFRLAEYSQGYTGYLMTHEVYSYCLDSLLMLFVMLLFNWAHPGRTFAENVF